MKIINCKNCLNMKVKNQMARCIKGHVFGERKRTIFDCRAQITSFGCIVGFMSWKIRECPDFIDNSPLTFSERLRSLKEEEKNENPAG